MHTLSEENYLKAIYAETLKAEYASTNHIAAQMETKASSATDMIKKLAEKQLIEYKKYKGCRLTKAGKTIALKIIRKHRLWETFLVEKLGFTWDKIHDIAEQLEHIQSPELTDKLDAFLGNPKYDPHGDPIPQKDGSVHRRKRVLLSEASANQQYVVVGVSDSSSDFLKYLNDLKLGLGTEVFLKEKYQFDNSMAIQIGNTVLQLSEKACNNIFVSEN